jgi:hypothetical protein
VLPLNSITPLKALQKTLKEAQKDMEEIGLPEGTEGNTVAKQQSQLQHLLDELISTEKSYFRDLEMMMNRYMYPTLEQTFLSPSEKKLVAETPPRLLSFQHTFTTKMVDAVDHPKQEYIEAAIAAAAGMTVPVPRKKTKSTSSVDLDSSVIEESMYDTLEIVRGWEQPVVHTLNRPHKVVAGSIGSPNDSTPAASEDVTAHHQTEDGGRDGNSAPRTPSKRHKLAASRTAKRQSLYHELEMVGEGHASASGLNSATDDNDVAEGGVGVGGGPRDSTIALALNAFIDPAKAEQSGHAPALKAAKVWMGKAGKQLTATHAHTADAWLAASLQQIGELFKSMLTDIKVYADYVAWHMAGSKLLVSTTNKELLAFVAKQNPSGSVVNGLGSYLIKPIQRVLKYPLLLKKMCEECAKVDKNKTTAENGSKTLMFGAAKDALMSALNGMQSLAATINEVTRRTEKFGGLMQAAIPSFLLGKEMGAVKVHNTVTWLNSDHSKKPEVVEMLVFPGMVVFFGGLSKAQLKKEGARGDTHFVLRILPSASLELPGAAWANFTLSSSLKKLTEQSPKTTWALVKQEQATRSNRAEEKFFLVSNNAEEMEAATRAIKEVIAEKLPPPAVYEDAASTNAGAAN